MAALRNPVENTVPVSTEVNGTVFVVDDDKAVRDSLRFLIESVGLPVETYPNATDFLEQCDADRPGCVRAPATIVP